MDGQNRLYLAGTGVITSLGSSIEMIFAAVNAGVSSYSISEHFDKEGNAITMALVPNALFDEISETLTMDEGDRYNEQHERITKMAIVAIQAACKDKNIQSPIPLLVANTDMSRDLTGLSSFNENVSENCVPYIESRLIRNFNFGRSAGINALDFAFQYLVNSPYEYVLVGGSDSYLDSSCLNELDKKDRLLSANNADGFAPGEGAGFLLLTRHPELALEKNGHIIAITKPGLAEEDGHMYSLSSYRGGGLDQAFKRALSNHQQPKIRTIYSSMNGENHWAKELGVAQIRNHTHLSEHVNVRHPADCYGDLGVATAPVLMALAAESLFKNDIPSDTVLVYASSDTACRGVVLMEKILKNKQPEV